MLPTPSSRSEAPTSGARVLILSADAVVAALLGALIETLGYVVRFNRPRELADEAMRRARPKVCLADSLDPEACTEELLGRARMRGVGVIIFGTSEALDRVRALAAQHSIETLRMPAEATVVDGVMKRAFQRAG